MKHTSICLACSKKFTVDSESISDQKIYYKNILSGSGQYQNINGYRPSTQEEMEDTMKYGSFLKCQPCASKYLPKMDIEFEAE